ncbi:hypothetical protein BTVI_75723 [Pitangus sulphuratus]|nr:hypothetical protein BTVI_75723 [Pitangus sulphuratus]
MASKGSKKKESGGHGSDSPKGTPASSQLGASNEKCRFPIWPEWNDADINEEKWDPGKPGKEKAGKGQISVPVVVQNETTFDLVSANEHIFCSEGCWRKIIVDDTMPFSEEENLLLPATACQNELWPMLLSKALIKVANTSIPETGKRELEEFTVLHTLTGWIPEVIPLQSEYLGKVWDFLKEIVPEFKLPDEKTPESDTTQPDTKPEEPKDTELKNEVSSVNKQSESSDKVEAPDNIGKESSVPTQPEMVVYAGCIPLHLFEEDFFSLKQMSDSSEKMRQYGLSHIHSHPVLITRTRSCPLEAPPQEPPVPGWKIFRQKKEVVLTSEPKEPEVKAPEEHVEIASLFLNYKLNFIRIPTDTHFPRSTITKGFHFVSRLTSVTESDENESDNNVDMNQNAEDNSQETTPFGQQNAEIPNKEELRKTVSFAAKQVSETADTDMKNQTGDKSKEETESEKTSVSRETWIGFEDFCVCFQNLYVFHNPDTYAYNYQKTDFKFTNDQAIYYLLVDSLMPIEIIVSFSALVHWDDTGGTKQECSSISKGVLTVEHFSWKSVTPGELVLKMHTSATKATVLNLPAGRHILLFTVSSPIGYHIHLCTMVPCVFGEEDAVMPALEKESSRFTEQATAILKAVGNVINNYSSEDELSKALKELELTLCPPGIHGTEMAEELYKVFNIAFWYLINYVIDKETSYRYKLAFRSFTLDFEDFKISGDDPVFSAENILNEYIVHEMRVEKDSKTSEQNLSSWQDRTPTSEEQAAALKIQAIWRGSYVRTVLKSRRPGTRENANVEETLKTLWSMIELNFEQCAVMLLREMFKRNFKSIEKFPCYEDEWCKMSFADYDVTCADHPPHVWFLVFRYSVKVKAPHTVTVHVQTSKSDVFIKLQVLDNEEEIISVTGKGHAVIPVFNFLSNESLLSSHSKMPQIVQSSTKKESETGHLKKKSRDSISKDRKTSSKPELIQEDPPMSIDESLEMIDESLENFQNSVGSPQQSHKYMIQALVLYESWPLPEDQSLSVEELKEEENDEIKGQEFANIPRSTRKHRASEKIEREKSQRESTESQQSILSKPHWTLRVVSEQKEVDVLEMKKDTQQADEIRAMKQAWESAEPGRAAKAFQERMRFINKCALRDSEKSRAGTETTSVTPSSGERGMKAPQAAIDSRLQRQKKKWELVDLSPYMRKTRSEAVLRNESIIQEQQIRKEEKVNHFRELQKLALEQREKEENDRALLKQNILEMYENLQASLDETRVRVHSIREAYRSNLLEAELRKQEELAAQEAALKAQKKKKSTDKAKPSKALKTRTAIAKYDTCLLKQIQGMNKHKNIPDNFRVLFSDTNPACTNEGHDLKVLAWNADTAVSSPLDMHLLDPGQVLQLDHRICTLHITKRKNGDWDKQGSVFSPPSTLAWTE